MTDEDDKLREQQRIDAFLDRIDGRHFDRAGRMISVREWCALFEDKSYQLLAQTWTRSGAWVSTVWLGLDHNWSSEGPPIIFESMVWTDGGDMLQERYATEEDAMAGHHEICERFGGIDPDRIDERRVQSLRPDFELDDDGEND